MEKPTASRHSALVVAVASSFITPFMASSINVALPAIERTFHIDAVLLSWVATSYILAIGVALVPMGRLADIYGRKKILGIGFIFFTTSTLLSALAWSIQSLIIFRIGQGFGSGMIFGTSMAILTSLYPPGERGRVLGISVSAVYIGLSSGPFIGGVLTLHLSWRSLFLLTFVFGLIALGLIFFKLKGEWSDAQGESFDIRGSVIYALTLIVLIVGFSLIPGKISFAMIAAGVLGIIIFVAWEKRIQHPVFQIDLLLNNRAFACSNLAALIHYSATTAITFLLSLYLQYIKGFNAQSAGLILVAQPILMALFSPLAGKISDRVEPRIIASLGMMLNFCALVLLSLIESDTNLTFVVAVLILLGFGFAVFSSPNMNAIMSSVDHRFLGLAAGSASTMRILGQLLSMGTATLVLAAVMGRSPISVGVYPQLIKSIRYCLSIFSGLTFIGIFASLTRGNIRNSQSQTNYNP